METGLKKLSNRKRLFLPFLDFGFRRISYSNVIESLIRIVPEELELTLDIVLKSSVWVDKDTGKLEILEHDGFWDFLTEIKQSPEESWFAVFFGTRDKSESIPHVFSTRSIVENRYDFQLGVSFVGEKWSLVILSRYHDNPCLITPEGRYIIGGSCAALDAILIEISEEEFNYFLKIDREKSDIFQLN